MGWSNTRTYFCNGARKNSISSKKENEKTIEEKSPSNKDIAILHMDYHPNDIPQKRVRDLWAKKCALLERSIDEGGLGIEQMISMPIRDRTT